MLLAANTRMMSTRWTWVMSVECQDYQGHGSGSFWKVTHIPFMGQCPPSPAAVTLGSREWLDYVCQRVEDKPHEDSGVRHVDEDIKVPGG